MALSPLEATVMALGLYEETGSLAYVLTTPRDLEAAAAVLRAGADLTVVADTLRQPSEPDQTALLNGYSFPLFPGVPDSARTVAP
jgi:tRNA nucleotidyltransferase (CCA-adding enzyme)